MTENADKIDNTQPLNSPLLRTARYIQITLKYAQYQGTGMAGQKYLNIMAQVHNVLKQKLQVYAASKLVKQWLFTAYLLKSW